MKPIVSDSSDSSYGCVDTLDGIDIYARELLRVKWPDGVVEELEVFVDTMTPRSSRREPWYRAYVVKLVHGAEARVYLAGTHAERLNPPRHRPKDVVHLVAGMSKRGTTYVVGSCAWDDGWRYSLTPLGDDRARDWWVHEEDVLGGPDPSDKAPYALILCPGDGPPLRAL